MKCDYCGYENKPDVRRCAFCGVELMKEEPIRQEYDPEYEKYKQERLKQERRKEWEKMFQAEQKQMPSFEKTPVWKKEDNKKGQVLERKEKEPSSLSVRLKRMPLWIKIVLLIMFFSKPVMALFWFLVWMLYDQSRRR